MMAWALAQPAQQNSVSFAPRRVSPQCAQACAAGAGADGGEEGGVGHFRNIRRVSA